MCIITQFVARGSLFRLLHRCFPRYTSFVLPLLLRPVMSNLQVLGEGISVCGKHQDARSTLNVL